MDRLSVQIYDRDRDVEVEKVTDRRVALRPPPPPPAPPKRSEMWTEITKDLVVREAIVELGYEYEETEYFYYVMQYLRYVSSSLSHPHDFFSSPPLPSFPGPFWTLKRSDWDTLTRY
jgi:hypothetical protein